MRVGHYYAQLLRGSSGVTSAITAWSTAMRAAGHDVVLAADAADPPPADDLGFSVRGVRHTSARRATACPLDLATVLADCDLVYLHEGWTLSHLGAAWALHRAGIPYVVMPHGVYEPGIRSTLKPPAALREAAERWLLTHALAVHVFFDSEGDLVRAVAPGASVLVAATGALAAAGQDGDQPAPGEAAPPTGRERGGYVAWFGRYEPHHKGLDLLLRGLAMVAEDVRPRVRLRGYDYRGGKLAVERLVAALDLGAWVSVGDRVSGAEKDAFVTRATCYVHPSRWESHSIALIEVLRLGVPVLVNSAIHIAPELARAGAAVPVTGTAQGWCDALTEVSRNGTPERLGEDALLYVRTRLAWDVVVKTWAEQLRELGLPA